MIRVTFSGDDGSWQLLLPSKTAMGILPGKRPIELSVRLFKSLLSAIFCPKTDMFNYHSYEELSKLEGNPL